MSDSTEKKDLKLTIEEQAAFDEMMRRMHRFAEEVPQILSLMAQAFQIAFEPVRQIIVMLEEGEELSKKETFDNVPEENKE